MTVWSWSLEASAEDSPLTTTIMSSAMFTATSSPQRTREEAVLKWSWVPFPDLASLFRLFSFPCS